MSLLTKAEYEAIANEAIGRIAAKKKQAELDQIEKNKAKCNNFAKKLPLLFLNEANQGRTRIYLDGSNNKNWELIDTFRLCAGQLDLDVVEYGDEKDDYRNRDISVRLKK